MSISNSADNLKSSVTQAEHGISSRAFVVRLTATVVLVNLFVIIVTGILLYQSWEHEKQRVRVNTQNLAKSLELSIIHIIEKSDVALHSVVEHAEAQLNHGLIDGQKLTDFTSRLHSHLPELHGLRVANAHGDIIYGTGLPSDRVVNIADRNYFKSARDSTNEDLIISEPVFGRISKQRVMHIARRVNNPDGSFAGVAYASFPINYFEKHFSTFNIGSNGTITLRNVELVTFVRYPAQKGGGTLGKKLVSPEFLNQLKLNKGSGTYTGNSPIDNVQRTYSYRRVNGYPLYVSIGLATVDYLASWKGVVKKGLLQDCVFLASTIISACLLFRYRKSKMKAQEELRRYYERLEELVKERTFELEAFNYAVSHDLRKPLTIISGYCGVISDLYADRLDMAGRDYLQNIENGIDSMSNLIDTLLNFSRITNCELQRETVSLSDLVMEIAASLKVAEPARRVEFRIAEGVTANCDRNLLQRVMENLLSNAWKYSSKREEATIEFGVKEVGGDPVYFVRDNGAGFDTTYAQMIFEPFKRLPGAEEYQGHGIGLSTVQRIIKRHGGRIWAEGSPDKGATIYFTL